MLFVPTERLDKYSWDTMRPMGPDPFSCTACLDTVTGGIGSDLPLPVQVGAELVAPTGSAGFELALAAERDVGGVMWRQTSPSRELGFGFIIAGVIAGISGLAGVRRQ